MHETRRPRGVTVIAILFAILAAYLAYVHISRMMDESVTEIRLLGIAIAAAWAAAAHGVWALKSWGWWLAISVPAVAALIDIPIVLNGGGVLVVAIDLVFLLVIVRYFTRSDIKALYRGPGRDAGA